MFVSVSVERVIRCSLTSCHEAFSRDEPPFCIRLWLLEENPEDDSNPEPWEWARSRSGNPRPVKACHDVSDSKPPHERDKSITLENKCRRAYGSLNRLKQPQSASFQMRNHTFISLAKISTVEMGLCYSRMSYFFNALSKTRVNSPPLWLSGQRSLKLCK